MKRFRDDRPADICFARGTFNSHPYVMARDARVPAAPRDAGDPRALRRSRRDAGTRAPRDSTRACATEGLPVQVANLSSIWTVLLHAAVALQLDAAVLPARRRPGAELGRHRPADLQPQLHARPTSRRSRTASSPPREAMQHDGWWWADPAATNKSIRRRSCARCSRTASRRRSLTPPSLRRSGLLVQRRRHAARDAGRSARRAADRAAPCSTA